MIYLFVKNEKNIFINLRSDSKGQTISDLYIFDHYNFASSGRLTQLVECHLYTVEVTGSSPVSPTTQIDLSLRSFIKLLGLN